MALDVLPGCAGLAAAAGAAAGDDGFAGVSEGELVGLLCAWDRVEAHAAARKLAVIAELDRRTPDPGDAEFTADEIACALGESRAAPMSCWTRPATWTPGCPVPGPRCATAR